MDKGQCKEFLLDREALLTLERNALKVRAQATGYTPELVAQEKKVSDELADVQDQLGRFGPV